MKYDFIDPEEEQAKMLLPYLQAQEIDHVSHTMNLERYEALVETLHSSPFRDKIVKEIPILRNAIAEIDAILVVAKEKMSA